MDAEDEEARRKLAAMVAPRVDEDRQFVLGPQVTALDGRHRHQGAALNLDLPTFLLRDTEDDVTAIRAALARLQGRPNSSTIAMMLPVHAASAFHFTSFLRSGLPTAAIMPRGVLA